MIEFKNDEMRILKNLKSNLGIRSPFSPQGGLRDR